MYRIVSGSNPRPGRVPRQRRSKTIVTFGTGLLLLAGVYGCAPANTPSPAVPTPPAAVVSPVPPGAITETPYPPIPTDLPATIGTPAAGSATPGAASTGITSEDAGQLLPLAPPWLTVTSLSGIVTLQWPGTGEDLLRYDVYRKDSPAREPALSGAEEWLLLGSVQPGADHRETYQFDDLSAKPGVSYLYGVRAVNVYGKESAIVEAGFTASATHG